MSCLPGHRLLSLPEGCWAWTGCCNNPPLTAMHYLCCLCVSVSRHCSKHPPKASSSRTELSTAVWFVAEYLAMRSGSDSSSAHQVALTCWAALALSPALAHQWGPLPGPRLDTGKSREKSGRGAQTWGNQAPNRWTKMDEGIQKGFLEDSLDTGGVGDKNLRVSLSHVWCRHSEQLEGWDLGGTGLRERCY